MSKHDNNQIQELFLAALKMPAQQRDVWLVQHCGDDEKLLNDVRSLLEHDDPENDPLEKGLNEGLEGCTGAFDASEIREASVEETIAYRHKGIHIRCPHCQNAVEVVDQDSLTGEVSCASCGSTFRLIDHKAARSVDVPREIAHFQLLQQLGTGAFGSVWKAHDTKLDRIVAIKIPRKGQLSPDEQIRFLREAQATAQLKHPNIVNVHEAGRQGDTIYIVNDFIDGVTLAENLEAGPLSPREAAMLCVKLADALQHAHVAKVIHRDLKPANVMLDTAGEPHVMDFGLAKRDAGEITMTMDGVILGTPAYMAPEQARGEIQAVDQRSDIYSLGVILFQLLTGECPFRGNVRMLLNQVLEDPPPSPRKLNASVPQDLETICLKCLEKSPARRYRAAQELAHDLNRWLDHEPIHARPPSSFYRAKLFAQRNKLLVASAFLITLILLGSSIVSSTLYIKTLAAQQATQAELFASEDLANFLTKDLLAAADPSVAQGRKVSVEEVLINAEASLNGRFPDRPIVKARIRDALASTYLSLGQTDKAVPHAEIAFQTLSEELGADASQTVVARTTLAKVYSKTKAHHDDAEALLADLIDLHERRDGKSARTTLRLRFDRAQLLRNRGQWSEVEKECREILASQRSTLGATDSATIETALLLANAIESVAVSSGYRSEEAARIFAEQYELAQNSLGEAHPITLNLAFEIAEQTAIRDQGHVALKMMREVLPRAEQTWGNEHPRTLTFLKFQGSLLTNQGSGDEAMVAYASLLERSRRAYGHNNPWAMDALEGLAALYSNRRTFVKALDFADQAWQAACQLEGPDSDRAISSRKRMAFQLMSLQRIDEAIEVYEELLTTIKASSRDVSSAFIKGEYGLSLASRNAPGDLERAEILQREGLKELIDSGGSAYNLVLLRYQRLVPTLFKLKKYSEVEKQCRLAQETCLERIDENSRFAWELAGITRSLALSLAGQKRLIEARNELSRINATLERKGHLNRGMVQILERGQSDIRTATNAFMLEVPFSPQAAGDFQVIWAAQFATEKEVTTSTGVRLQLIPPGKFDFTRAANDNVPASGPMQITLTDAFYLSASEITVEQFKKFIDATGYTTDAERAGGSQRFDGKSKQVVLDDGKWWGHPGYDQDPDHPVACVSWNDAQAFCRWLSDQEGRPFHLPTEAEWEWSARAGSNDDYFFGNDATQLAEYAICIQSGHRQTASVTLKKPNAWGIHGVLGNVQEWIDDDSMGYDGKSSVNPFHATDGEYRVRRGGADGFDASTCVISKRMYWHKTHSNDRLGFRVASPVDWQNSEETRIQAACADAEQQQSATSQELRLPIDWKNSIEMRFRLVPAGNLSLGSPESENGRGEDETPFRVKLTRPFYLGETEVTVAQFRAFVEKSGYTTHAEKLGSRTVWRNGKQTPGLNWKSPGYQQSDTHPVVMLRRADCEAFCAWLSQQENKKYRLPSEAEWEYACRSETRTPHHFSRREKLSNYAQVGKGSDSAARAVRLLKPNPWGLYDMYGNLSEWTADWYGEYPLGMATNPRGAATGKQAVIRGGSWMNHHSSMRSAARLKTHVQVQSDGIGFRVLLEINESNPR